MDYGLHDQHSSYIRRQSLRGEEDADLDTSWVMLSRTGEIEPLPNERILHKTRGRISFELSAVNQQPSPAAAFSRKSDNGTAYITNQRVIYLPAKPTEEFKSFSSKILGCQDTRADSSWFGPWYWQATVRPVPDGNIPPEVTWARVKLVFNDGGFSDFQAKFVEINGRLHHAAQLAQETGQTNLLQTVHDEELPEYRPRQTEGDSSQAEARAVREADEANQRAQGSQQVPDEPPPNYDEAQAQAISMRFDERAREEAERE
ncbi:hypothetical protein DL768_004436 [Monosporascus sp. mg162]|nr:hypothetical protein DL768_004436 [Monosporascus sp. mg162]